MSVLLIVILTNRCGFERSVGLFGDQGHLNPTNQFFGFGTNRFGWGAELIQTRIASGALSVRLVDAEGNILPVSAKSEQVLKATSFAHDESLLKVIKEHEITIATTDLECRRKTELALDEIRTKYSEAFLNDSRDLFDEVQLVSGDR